MIYVMHLLTLKKLTLHFTNPLVNVALKFYVVSLFNFMQLLPLKLETQSKFPEFTPSLDKINRNLGE